MFPQPVENFCGNLAPSVAERAGFRLNAAFTPPHLPAERQFLPIGPCGKRPESPPAAPRFDETSTFAPQIDKDSALRRIPRQTPGFPKEDTSTGKLWKTASSDPTPPTRTEQRSPSGSLLAAVEKDRKKPALFPRFSAPFPGNPACRSADSPDPASPRPCLKYPSRAGFSSRRRLEGPAILHAGIRTFPKKSHPLRLLLLLILIITSISSLSIARARAVPGDRWQAHFASPRRPGGARRHIAGSLCKPARSGSLILPAHERLRGCTR